MKVAIMGSGGVGGYFGARLAQAGEEVTFIARGEHLAAIRHHGLAVSSIEGDVTLDPARGTDDPAEVGVVDAVIVAVKAWQVRQAGVPTPVNAMIHAALLPQERAARGDDVPR